VDVIEDQRQARIDQGKVLVRTGWLKELRQELGVSANVVAGWIDSNSHHVGRLETGGVKWIQERTAYRIALLHSAYAEAGHWLGAEGLGWDKVETLRGAAHRLGMAVSTLRSKLDKAGVEPIQFGPILGEWIEKAEADACRR
jgi:hypothetical protein